jgi:hypothetical protein
MENHFEHTAQSNEQRPEEPSSEEIIWEEIFEGIPVAPGTEAAQQRHKQLRAQDDMTEEEEAELNALFYAIYPQFLPEDRKESQMNEPEDGMKQRFPKERNARGRQEEITLALGLVEMLWGAATLLHCGFTFHGLLGCVLVWLCCSILNSLQRARTLKGSGKG